MTRTPDAEILRPLKQTNQGETHMLLGDIIFSLMTAIINSLFTTPIFSILNNLFGIPFRLAGV